MLPKIIEGKKQLEKCRKRRRREKDQNVISERGPGSSTVSSSSAHTSGLRLENASMLVRSEMRAAISPSSSSSLPPLLSTSSRGNSGPSGQLGQVPSAVWISRWMCVSSWTLSRSWALRASRMRRWVSLAADKASIWLRADSPLASSREFSSSKICQTSTNQSNRCSQPLSTHYVNPINNLSFASFFDSSIAKWEGERREQDYRPPALADPDDPPKK